MLPHARSSRRHPAAVPLLAWAWFLVTSTPACAKKSGEMGGAQTTPLSAPASGEGTALAGEKAPANPAAAPAGKAPADTSAPPGIDLSGFDEFEKRVFFRIVNTEASVCGKAHSLIVSAKTDKGCRKGFYAIRYVARLVKGGFTDSEVEKALQERYRQVVIQRVDIAGSPSKGNPNAPVSLVEFVDYECPHCARVQPVFRQILEEFGNDVKVTLKHYPLGQHTNARLAAAASMAAHKQGKFWPYNEKVWENADSLTKALLEKLATDVGLDLVKFRADFDAPETAALVQKDRDEGGRLGLKSTPTIFINGKLYTDSRDVDGLRDWITEELGR